MSYPKKMKKLLAPHTLCRLCSEPSAAKKLLFFLDGEPTPAYDKIESLLRIKLQHNPFLPASICSNCSSKLADFDIFLKSVIAVQQLFSDSVEEPHFSIIPFDPAKSASAGEVIETKNSTCKVSSSSSLGPVRLRQFEELMTRGINDIVKRGSNLYDEKNVANNGNVDVEMYENSFLANGNSSSEPVPFWSPLQISCVRSCSKKELEQRSCPVKLKEDSEEVIEVSNDSDCSVIPVVNPKNQEKKDFMCSFCNVSYQFKKDLTRHMKALHSNRGTPLSVKLGLRAKLASVSFPNEVLQVEMGKDFNECYNEVKGEETKKNPSNEASTVSAPIKQTNLSNSKKTNVLCYKCNKQYSSYFLVLFHLLNDCQDSVLEDHESIRGISRIELKKQCKKSSTLESTFLAEVREEIQSNLKNRDDITQELLSKTQEVEEQLDKYIKRIIKN